MYKINSQNLQRRGVVVSAGDVAKSRLPHLMEPQTALDRARSLDEAVVKTRQRIANSRDPEEVRGMSKRLKALKLLRRRPEEIVDAFFRSWAYQNLPREKFLGGMTWAKAQYDQLKADADFHKE